MGRLDSIKKQYAENSAPKKPKTKHVFNKDVYFGTFLDEGINSAQKQIRIIEPKGENDSPLVEIMGHKKQVGTKWPTFICPKHERGEACPFCEARDILLAEGSEESRKEAILFSAKKMYIVKVIDMIISITKDGKNSVVTGINYNMTQTPLSEDDTQSAEWLEYAHNKNWDDGIFSIKPYDYLEIIVRGGTPIWQKNTNGEGGTYIDKDSEDTAPAKPESAHDSELSMGINTVNEATTAQVAETVSPVSPVSPVVETPSTPSVMDEEDDDLPF